MYLILTSKSTYNKLVAEIRESFKSHEDITWNNVKDLPYLGACISEALRMLPPAPGNFCRTVPSGGGSIDGNWIPADVSLTFAYT